MGPDTEFQEYDSTNAWAKVYQKIRLESMKQEHTLKDARKPEFRSRNRYRDVSPYDHSRVALKRDNIDYINASLVKAPRANRSYILTQGPLPHTTSHFWLLVWESNSKAVLMLNRVVECGRIKCNQYFPMGTESEGEDTMTFDDVGLEVTYMSQKDYDNFTVRTFELSDLQSGDKKEVLQFHYTTWPDFGVPESPEAFLTFLMAVRECGALEPDVGPPVIHCSAGIGRSGTFCLVDTSLVLIEESGDPASINVIELLMEMRQYRMGLIQTPDQLRFSFLAIIEGIKWVLTPSPDSGFEDKGLPDTGFEDKHILQPSALKGSSPLSDDTATTGNNNIEEDLSESDDSLPSTPPPIPPRLNGPVPTAARITANPGVTNGVATEDETAGNPSPGASSFAGDSEEVYNNKSEEFDVDNLRAQNMEIRRRNRDERIKNTAEQIKRMKQRQQDHEKWRVRKNTVQPYLIGLSVAVVIGGYFLYKFYIT